MHRFYVTGAQINGDIVTITGPDVNHIRNVLRMKPGEEIVICNGQGKDCYCIINRVSDTDITAAISLVCDTDT
jgi:16S rRNA (uracil1498-N3)-methyltransferase